jgi:hypothetical protein
MPNTPIMYTLLQRGLGRVMYNIARKNGYLLVKFLEDFDFSMIQAAIHHETMLGEYAETNDIWVLSDKRADIHLGELETLVNEFQCRCPRNASRTKTAIVVDEGLTSAIIELWVTGLRKKVSFEIEMFRTLEEAKDWLGIKEFSFA